jgi:putative membrane protein
MDQYYSIFKAIHVISVIAWMAGILYLPRLYVYHAEAKLDSDLDQTLKIMEYRLLKFIMNPAMISTYFFGLLVAYMYGLVALGLWFNIKMIAVLIMTIIHALLARWRRDFNEGKNIHSAKFYRVVNEIPTVCMIVAVIMVIVKPFE